MLSLTDISESVVREMLLQVRDAAYSYSQVGCVAAETIPRGYRRDAHNVLLGHGADVWQAARAAIDGWAVFPLSMVRLVRLSDVVEPGTVVAVLATAAGIRTANPARILTKHDETGPVRRYGFTYGTLPGHVEAGEEEFGVEWDTATNAVTYRLKAVSRPNHLLVWLGYPLARAMQARFRVLSGESVLAHVQGCVAPSSNG